MKARKKYDVKYPLLYAPEKHPDATAFNCAQRAHQNTLENIAMVNISMLANAILFPTLSATLGAIWCVGRVLYIHGYSTGGPKGRTLGGGAPARPPLARAARRAARRARSARARSTRRLAFDAPVARRRSRLPPGRPPPLPAHLLLRDQDARLSAPGHPGVHPARAKPSGARVPRC
jgi:glutathione S-transferase